MAPRLFLIMEFPGNQNARPGDGRLARVDPRLKLLLVLIAIATVFSTMAWSRLFLLASIAIALLVDTAALGDFRLRLFWLKWFLLIILLLHMLLSPGYTLFGVAWLSYDGLMRGMQIIFQIITALGFSLALTRSTSAEQLTAAATSLLRPLKLFGLNVRTFSRQILMTLHFVPILRQEGIAALQKARAGNPHIAGRGLIASIRIIPVMMMPLFLQLIQRADVLATAAAAGNDPTPDLIHLPAFWPVATVDRMAICVAAVVLLALSGLR